MSKISIEAAAALASDVLEVSGYTAEEAAIIADHLMDCELRGLGFSGLARVLSIRDRLASLPATPAQMTLTRETPVSAQLDGGDNLGYLVARRATETAIEKAKASGIGIVGASRTWYTGMLSYYAEMITKAGQVALIVSNTSAWVAPFGGTSPIFGTNPICIAFPSRATPFVWDIGISEIIHAQVVLAGRRGEELPKGVAYGPDGEPTVDPAKALQGALVSWGGHRGSGLGMAVQLLGALAGSPVVPGEMEGFGFLVLAISPELFGEPDEFEQKVSSFIDAVHEVRPLDPERPVRVPFERSAAERQRRKESGQIEVPDIVVEQLRGLIADAEAARN